MFSITSDETKATSAEGVSRERAIAAFEMFLEAIGLNTQEENLRGTPERVAKAFIDELFIGLYSKLPEIKTFDTPISTRLHTVDLTDLTVRSMCAHHFMPITGKAQVLAVFIPDANNRAKLPGLSKYARVVEHFSRRPQLQERLTQQIADYLIETVGAVLIGVKVTAKHHCMSHRGVESHPEGETITTVVQRVNSSTIIDPYIRGLVDSIEKDFYKPSFRCS